MEQIAYENVGARLGLYVVTLIEHLNGRSKNAEMSYSHSCHLQKTLRELYLQ